MRESVRHVQQAMEVSERRTCRVLGQSRRMQRYQPRTRDDEGQLVAAMLEHVKQRPRYGYRRIWALLRANGWSVNLKRVYRLWKQNGLKVPAKQHKKRRVGTSDNGCARRCATHKNHVWAWDFIHDRTRDGRSIKWLSILDEYTRECLALEVERSMTAGDVLDVLIDLIGARGMPQHVRSDNGPEFIAKAIRSWLTLSRIDALYIEPGSPWQNGYAESFGSKLRDELLNVEEFENLAMAKSLGLNWRQDYNHRRPHSSLGYRTPAEFAASLADPPVAPLPADQPAKQQAKLS